MGKARKTQPWLRRVDNVYLLTLMQNYVLLKGGVGSTCLYGALPLFFFKFGVDAATYQAYLALVFLSWSAKALVAAISDTYPIQGWHKRYYIVGAVSVLTMALFGVGMSQAPKDALGFLMVCSFCIMTIDTLYEGITAALVSFYGADNKIVSWSWEMVMSGTLIGALIIGPVGDYQNGKYINYAFYGAMLFAIQAILPVSLYPARALPYDDVQRDPTMAQPLLLAGAEQPQEPVALISRPPSTSEWVLVLWLTAASLILAAVLGATASHRDPIAVSVVCPLVIVLLMGLLWHNYRDREVYLGTCVFVFLHEMLCVNIQGVLDAFYTAPDSCMINGPGFELWFFTSVINLISAVVGVCAVVLYNRVFSAWTVRSTMQVALLVRMFGSLFDLSIAMRWNRDFLGISDSVFFVFGGAVVEPTASMLVTIASATLVSNTVYQGRATTTYAILLSFQYLGQSMARILGLMIASFLGVRANRYTGCNFDNLPELIVFSEVVIPFLAICLAYVLVPNIAFGARVSQLKKPACCGLIRGQGAKHE